MAITAAGKFQYPVGRDGAKALGYDPVVLEGAAATLLDSFCGVGNPFSLGQIRPGAGILDFGCGAGFDLYVAGLSAGKAGFVCGVDLTEDMVKKARTNLASAGIGHAEVKKLDSETIPYEDQTFDVVISNGVINLCPDKPACFREIYRVLKAGGKFQFADVVLEHQLPENIAGSPEAWSQ